MNIFIAVISVALALSIRSDARAADARPAWEISVETVDRALRARDISAAEIAWRKAYGAAIRSRGWKGLVAVGDAALRMGDQASRKQPYTGRAREIYLAALFHARQHGSLDGVLRVAEAFAALGDAEVARQALQIADGLASKDPSGDAQRRVVDTRQRIAPSPGSSAYADPLPLLFPDAAVGP